jgi:hypothetical protein
MEGAFMGWEARKRGSSYYTRSKWKDGRVVRQYVGTGPLAEIVALEDELKRLQKEEEIAYCREERERLERDAAFLRELEVAARILTRAHLLAAGCHKHKGEWRRLREQSA